MSGQRTVSTPAATPRPPHAWMRLGTMVAAVGYGAVGAIGWLDDGPEKVQDAAVSLILFVVFACTLRRPQIASAVTLAVVLAELSFSTYSNGRVLVAATYVYPLLALTAGLMFGGRAALAMWLSCGLALPLLLYASGAWGSDLSLLTASEAVALTVVEVVLAATAIITYVTLRAYFRVLESSERMRLRFVDLFEHAPDGLLAVDGAGRITEANELAERLLEQERASLVGLPLADAFLQAGADTQAVAGIGAASTPVLIRVGAKAAGRTLEVLAREVMGGSQLVLRNVTERRALEEQLAHAQRMETVGLLAGGVAHDFNNLLTIVKGNAALLSNHADERVRRLAGEIGDAGRRGAALTRRLLSTARRDLRSPEQVDLSDVVALMMPLLERFLGRRYRLEISSPKSAGTWVDQTQVEQVVFNLVSNARDAMPEGGVIELAVECLSAEGALGLGSALSPGRQVMLEVRDRGVGMSPELRQRIFEPFFTTKPPGKGTGLGLAAVHGIVSSNGGHIAVESVPGQGSSFRVFFPEVALPPPGERQPRRDFAARARGRILVVDDEEIVRAFVERVLTLDGYDVTTTKDGTLALEICSQDTSLSLVLIDVQMPGISGIELGQRLRVQHPELPILFMSGYFDHLAAPDHGLDPATNLVPKPFDPVDLVERISQLLASSARPAQR